MKIRKLLDEKPLVSILSIPFVLMLLLESASPGVLLVPVVFFLIESKLDFSKKYFYAFFVFLFYCQIIFDDTKFSLQDLRLRHFSLLFLIFSILLNYTLLRKRKLIKFINVFLLIFSCNILLFNLFFSLKEFNREEFLINLDFKYNKIDLNTNKSTRPVILIVLDAFSSTSEIFNHTKDSLDLELDLFLKSKDYLIYNKTITKTERTTLSLPSIFNFNLHNSFKNDSIEMLDKYFQKLNGFGEVFKENLLVDSLNLKSIDAYSYGLVRFVNGINDQDFFYFWEDEFPNLSVLNAILNKTIIGTYLHGVNRETTYIDNFRKQSLEKLINLKPKENSFYYFHLFFPHDPYSFFEEYPNRDLNFLTLSENEYLEEHIKYKRWFTHKLITTLNKTSFESSRVIITGDHGFRHNKIINPRLTNIYFKGYTIDVTDKVNSVQDLGYLINESF